MLKLITKLTGSKWALMNGRGKVKLLGQWSGKEKSGLWFSNTYWKNRVTTQTWGSNTGSSSYGQFSHFRDSEEDWWNKDKDWVYEEDQKTGRWIRYYRGQQKTVDKVDATSIERVRQLGDGYIGEMSCGAYGRMSG